MLKRVKTDSGAVIYDVVEVRGCILEESLMVDVEEVILEVGICLRSIKKLW